METHIYVDETKAKEYLVVAACIPSTEVADLRKVLRDLVLPRQRSLHMKNERDSRRRIIADTIARMADRGLQVTIYNAGRQDRDERRRRARCLQGLVEDAAHFLQSAITFDRDASLESWDRQRMIELTRAHDCRDRLRYSHSERSAEMLLAIPDAVAWCWARGGDWRRRVEPIVRGVRQV